MTKVYYKRLIEGITVPAVIHNMGYYYINMPVYEDGSVDCWNRKSLEELKDELARGWVVTEIPTGKNISIHGLGQYAIKDANWEHISDSYYDYIYDTVKKMNNNMTGLFEETVEQKEKWKTRKAGWSTWKKPYKLRGNFGYTLVDGDSSSIFFRQENRWELTSVIAYADETLMLGTDENLYSLDEIKEMFAKGILSSNIEGEFELFIPNLARLTLEGNYQVHTEEKQKELEDMSAKISGNKSLHQICKEMYLDYLIYPTEFNRERLRIAYENVPKHMRMYLGDMDTKDRDYQRILYHPEVKREV